MKKKRLNRRRGERKRERERDPGSETASSPSPAARASDASKLEAPDPSVSLPRSTPDETVECGRECPAAGDVAGEVDGPERLSESATETEGDFDEGIVEHVQLLASLIDGKELSRRETIELLRRVMRQHSIAKETALDYVLRSLQERPP